MAENKTDMWLGVNIRSAGAGKKVVVSESFLSTFKHVVQPGISMNVILLLQFAIIFTFELLLSNKGPFTEQQNSHSWGK